MKKPKNIEVVNEKDTVVRVIDHFVLMVRNPELREASIRAGERTQDLLGASWNNAMANEKRFDA